MSTEKLLCYNRGCGMAYEPATNSPNSCRFHPGYPFFHETYKGWSCCNKKSTDFTEFLDIKGCQVGAHSNEKQIEEEIPREEPVIQEVEPIPAPITEPKPRPSADAPLIPLPRSVTSSLEKALQSLEDNPKSQEGDIDELDNSVAISIGSPCYNNGCGVTYEGTNSLTSKCSYHTGVPVFHEGMKYWSCCQRKTSDFDAFLNQVGCEEGKHLWRKPKIISGSEDKTKSCRMDWHQTSDDIVITVYSKLPIPSLSKVEVNPVRVRILITFGNDRQEYANDLILFGLIDVDGSNVSFMGTKVEITLRKGENIAWSKLYLSK